MMMRTHKINLLWPIFEITAAGFYQGFDPPHVWHGLTSSVRCVTLTDSESLEHGVMAMAAETQGPGQFTALHDHR